MFMRPTAIRYYNQLKRQYAQLRNERNKQRLLGGYDRVYHVHIRKTAGTSVNGAFWELGDRKLENIRRKTLFFGNQLTFVRNDKQLIEDGNYFFGNSHIPYWKLSLPENTFKFSLLRDPLKRVVSLYKYYSWIDSLSPESATEEEPYYEHVKNEVKDFLGDGFRDFLERLTDIHKMNQVYTFSQELDPDEAFENISSLDAVYFQSEFEHSIQNLNQRLGLNLKIRNDRRSTAEFDPKLQKEDKNWAKSKLELEYQFYNKCTQTFRAKSID